MGLREIKKERARTAILKAARDMFFSDGFDGTTIEEIAAAAEVAVGTVYNYFDSKSALILAITAEDTSKVLDEDFRLPESCTGFEGIKMYLDTFMENFSAYPRRLLRELMREAWYHDSTISKGFIRQDMTLLDGLAGMLRELSEKQKLKPGTDIEHAALVIYGIVTTAIMRFAADEERTSDQMLDSVERMLEVLFSGLVREGRDK